jgi:hypothetical protein
MIDALPIAEEAGILVPRNGGWSSPVATKKAAAKLKIEGEGGPARLLLRVEGDAPPAVTFADVAITPARLGTSDVWVAEIAEASSGGGRILVSATHERGIRGMWLVRRATEIPPPPPRAWDAGPEPPDP